MQPGRSRELVTCCRATWGEFNEDLRVYQGEPFARTSFPLFCPWLADRESRSQFWRPFFEAAASMRLNEPNADDSNSVATEEPTRNSASPDRTVSSAGDQTYSRQSDASEDLEGTPRAKRHDLDDLSPSSSSLPSEPQWSSDKHNQFASPFLSSKQNERQGPPSNSAMKQQPSSSSHALPELQRLRLRDLPPDSPDVPEPEFETAVFGGIGGDSKGKGRSFDLSSDPTSPSFSLLRDPSPSPSDAGSRPPPVPQSPRNPRAGGGDQAHSKLLDKILRKNLASPAPPRAGPGSSTPGRPNAARTGNNKIAFPPDLPKEWDGIANLSQTSLDAFPSPIKRRQSTSTEDSFAAHLIAPPSTLRHPSYLTSSPALPRAASSSTSTSRSQPPPPPPASYSSPAKYTRTPAKYAARLTAQNVYDSLGLNDSPLPSPPSILRTNTKPFNMYEHTQRLSMAHQPIDSPTKERSMRAAGGGGGKGNNRAVEQEESFASNVSTSTIPNQPSFVDPDRSQTRPFDLYEYQNKQNQPDSSSRVGEDTDNIDDLLNGGKTMTFHQAQRASMLPQQGMVDLGGIVDDDYDEERREYPGDGREAGRDEYEDELSYAGARHEEDQVAMLEGQGYAIGGGGGDEDESFNIERGLRAGVAGGVGFGKRLMDGPEDTLFGMPPAQSQSQQGQLQSQIRDEGQGERYQDDDTFTDTQEPLRPQEQGRGNGGRGFRLHGLSDMETLHGGELLSSGQSFVSLSFSSVVS